jgi:16S rRNA (guanine527-N7)-methyltransferase
LETDQELLISGLSELGIKPADVVIRHFISYLHELKKWNRAYSLTAIHDNRDIIIKHFMDSLLFLKAVPEGQWRICDVGSGAGFPGLPMAIVRPDITVALIEPSRKKTAFLKHMKRTLFLNNVTVLESRVEDVKEPAFDIAVTRALFSIGDFIKKAGPILKEGGFLVLNKGPKFEEEIKGVPAHVRYEIIPVALPLTVLRRSIIKVYMD